MCGHTKGFLVGIYAGTAHPTRADPQAQRVPYTQSKPDPKVMYIRRSETSRPTPKE
jgi:hypothetical protein